MSSGSGYGLAATSLAAATAMVPARGAGLLLGASIPEAPLAALVLSFFAYSFVGWAWESTACSMMNQGRFSNSGFLLGPFCPIYGVGALSCWLLLRGISNSVALFLAAGLLCCTIEWFVGLGLERMTGARFWDYEDQPLNIKGRVCLYGFLLFGAGATLICRVTEPALLLVMARVPNVLLAGLTVALCVGLLVDFVFAMASWRRLSSRLEETRAQIAVRLNDSLTEASDRMVEGLPEGAVDALGDAYVRARGISDELASRLDVRGPGAALGGLASRLASKAPRGDRGGLSTQLREGIARLAGERGGAAAGWFSEAGDRLGALLGRRELRFFNAFPRLRFWRYDSVISATELRRRARELFSRRRR